MGASSSLFRPSTPYEDLPNILFQSSTKKIRSYVAAASNQAFREKFLKSLEAKTNKGLHVQCFRKLEIMRKDLVLKSKTQAMREELEVTSPICDVVDDDDDELTNGKKIKNSDSAITTVCPKITLSGEEENDAEVSDNHFPSNEIILQRGLSLLNESTPTTTNNKCPLSNAELLAQVIEIQEAILTIVFEDFEEFLETHRHEIIPTTLLGDENSS